MGNCNFKADKDKESVQGKHSIDNNFIAISKSQF